jgi:hypothetical protein
MAHTNGSARYINVNLSIKRNAKGERFFRLLTKAVADSHQTRSKFVVGLLTPLLLKPAQPARASSDK